MSKEKFTPEPWYCTSLGQIGKKGEKHPICLATFHWETQGDETMLANARLATVSPKMYRFIKKVVGILEWANEPALAQQGREILAEALGEKQ